MMNQTWFQTLSTLALLALTAWTVHLMLKQQGGSHGDCGCKKKSEKLQTPSCTKSYPGSGSSLGKKVMQ